MVTAVKGLKLKEQNMFHILVAALNDMELSNVTTPEPPAQPSTSGASYVNSGKLAVYRQYELTSCRLWVVGVTKCMVRVGSCPFTKSLF